MHALATDALASRPTTCPGARVPAGVAARLAVTEVQFDGHAGSPLLSLVSAAKMAGVVSVFEIRTSSTYQPSSF
jgi:hypothetical protein